MVKPIFWNKHTNDYLIKYTIGTTINPNLAVELRSRLAVTGDHTAGNYHLSISDVRKSDEGIYDCALSGTSSVSRLQLTVISKYRGDFDCHLPILIVISETSL